MKLAELPKGLVAVLLIFVGWAIGYYHAWATNSAPAPQGPYRSVPAQNATGPAPVPGNYAPGPMYGQGGSWPTPPNAPSYQAPAHYPSMEERQKQWEAYQQERQRREEEAHKRWQQQQAEMQKQQAEFEKMHRERFAQMQQREADAMSGQRKAPPVPDSKEWKKHQQQWEANRKEYEAQMQKQQQAWQQQNEKWLKEREEFYKKHAPQGGFMQRPDWANAPRPNWNNDERKKYYAQIEKRRQEMEKRRQEYMANRPHPQFPDFAQSMNRPYPNPWSYPLYPAPGRDDMRMRPPVYGPQYNMPGPGYYPPPWFNRGYNYGPRW